MIVIPAVDIKGGRAVRLRQGRADDETVYSDDPVAAALRWSSAGAKRVHVVDLDGAFRGEPRNIETIERIIAELGCEVEVGGGLRAREAVARLISSGAARAILGTVAAEDMDAFGEIACEFPGLVSLAVDARDGLVSTRGWTQSTSLEAVEFVRSFEGMPLGEVIYTDISRDGMLTGPNVEAMKKMVDSSPFDVIASGGVGSVDDIRALAGTGAWGAIVGKALYDGRVAIEDALAAGD